jgi:hypothetical protein
MVAVLAVAALAVSCAPPPKPATKGKSLTAEEFWVVQENLAKMEMRMAQQFRESLEEKGLRPATADELVARLSGNTHHTVTSSIRLSAYYAPDGTLAASFVNRQGEFRSAGTWWINEDGARCLILEKLRFRDPDTGRLTYSYGEAWKKAYEANCYVSYFEGDTDHWILLSGPHHLKSGQSEIVPGNPFDL